MSTEIDGLLARIDVMNEALKHNADAIVNCPGAGYPQMQARGTLARKLNLLESVVRLVCEELEKTVFVPSPYYPFDEEHCVICRKEINRGDRCYDHGAEIYTCSKKCADKYESREPAFSSKDYTTRS